jgi:hypothetical protein
MMVIRVHTFFLMLFRLSFYAVVLCFLSSIGACDKGSQDLAKLQQEYDKAMQHALVKVPYARDFKKTFPTSCELFSYFSGEYGAPTLICKGALYGRYILTMHVEVKFDSSRTEVISYGKPKFHLGEVIRITPLPDGRVEIFSHTLDFDEQAWKTIVEHGGDFSSAGFDLKKDDPVAGFDQHWWEG